MSSTQKFAIIITSISAPNAVIKLIAEKIIERPGSKFYVIGDTKSPEDFEQAGCDFYSIKDQLSTRLKIADGLPVRHYSRKNIGYLLAWRDGFDCIVETDDDNFPLNQFWQSRTPDLTGYTIPEKNWVNVYRWFSDVNIWPRGLPLEKLEEANLFTVNQTEETHYCPVQQGLANQNPDVDAVYRMTGVLPLDFEDKTSLILREGQWCPFNSQNTTWFKEAFPLLYLPSYCSFRMTDIWRSFVAQRVAWACGWGINFHQATVYQERNEHNLLKDFEDEIPGYLHNQKLIQELEKLNLTAGFENIYENLYTCYEMMVEKKFISSADELTLVRKWIDDCKSITDQEK